MTARAGKKLIAYLRVSTARQGASGLGLEAQRAAVHAYAAAGGHSIVAEHVEVESGAKADRPQLAAALAACRLHRATLVIAKLDRLARNVAFIANLMEAGTDFVACDMPMANGLTLHLMAAMAQFEREQISQRTKAALAAAKARGVRLGQPQRRGGAAGRVQGGSGEGGRGTAGGSGEQGSGGGAFVGAAGSGGRARAGRGGASAEPTQDTGAKRPKLVRRPDLAG